MNEQQNEGTTFEEARTIFGGSKDFFRIRFNEQYLAFENTLIFFIIISSCLCLAL